jgi:hypothetical protein
MYLDTKLYVRDVGAGGSNPLTPTIYWRTTGALLSYLIRFTARQIITSNMEGICVNLPLNK